MWVNDEVSQDRFHQKGDQLYQVIEHRVRAQGILTSQTTSTPLAESLAEELPEVEYAAATVGAGYSTLSVDENSFKAIGRYAGKDFFNIFSYKLILGDKDKVLTDRNSIVISESK